MAKILIVGCGDLGAELAAVLAQDGHEVTGLKRNPPAAAAAMRYYRADIARTEELRALDTDFEFLFFIVSPDGRDEQNYRAVYASGVNNLLEHFASCDPAPQWFFVSSSSVYGQAQGEWVDEDSPAEPINATGRIIRQAEQRLVAASRNNVVVRFSGIYGPGRESLLRMAMHAPPIQRDPPYYTNRIHRRDCIGVLTFLLRQRLAGRPLDQCYLASDDDPAPLCEVVSWLAERTHCRPPVVRAPAKNVSLNKRCNNARLKALGYDFRYPGYKEGYGELLGQKT